MMIVESVYDPESSLQWSGPTYEVWFNSNDAKCLCYSNEVNVLNLVLMVLKYLFNTMQIQALSFVFSCVQMLTGHEGKNYLSKYFEMQR